MKWEQESFGDMHMIEMEENMDDGKSYEYFTSLANMYPEDIAEEDRPWDYAMKVDDDSFLNIPNLLEKLRPLTPRQNTWFVRIPLSATIDSRAEETKKFITCLDRDMFSRGIW